IARTSLDFLNSHPPHYLSAPIARGDIWLWFYCTMALREFERLGYHFDWNKDRTAAETYNLYERMWLAFPEWLQQRLAASDPRRARIPQNTGNPVGGDIGGVIADSTIIQFLRKRHWGLYSRYASEFYFTTLMFGDHPSCAFHDKVTKGTYNL